MCNLEKSKHVPRSILAEVIPAKMCSMLLNKGLVNLYVLQHTEALLVRAEKKYVNCNFSIPHAKQCIQITCFRDCHSVTLVTVEVVFASLEIMLLVADFIA